MLASSAAAAGRWYRLRRPAIARGFLIALAATIALLWFVEPAMLAHRLIRTDAVPTDGAYVGRMIANDAQASAPDVLVIGGSSTRVLIPQDADQRMSHLCGRATYLLDAATSAQHPADSRAIADALRRPPALIVVGMSYRRFSSSVWNDPFALDQARVELPRSPHAFLVALAHGRANGGLFDSLAQLRRMDWERQLASGAWRGTPMLRDARARNLFDISPEVIKSPAERQFDADTMWTVDGGALAAGIEGMTHFWIDFARDMQRRGSRTVFVMPPDSRETAAIGRAYAAPVGRAFSAIAREFTVIDMRVLPIPDSEFRDALHVTKAARARLWPWLSAQIAGHGGCAAPVAD